ncbi:hypothetical protein DLJ53_11875 [Acuticoccus sediminis]|uniref:MaoC dehydratase-like protein n=1 Tax=Acuticoccus sediminis TaxID=2184697 RepID=A0A8B2NUT7_9HYPH|nr:hypothetical protein DLJ53_11875 [Acuticoccus sediminis]
MDADGAEAVVRAADAHGVQRSEPRRLLRFDDFRPGTEIARADMEVPAEAAEQLHRAFPDLAAEDASVELTIAMLMRAYTRLVAPRPPGNIHAGQEMRIHRVLTPGERFQARADCIDKETKAGRNWVRFGLVLETAAGPLVDAKMRFVWAQ